MAAPRIGGTSCGQTVLLGWAASPDGELPGGGGGGAHLRGDDAVPAGQVGAAQHAWEALPQPHAQRPQLLLACAAPGGGHPRLGGGKRCGRVGPAQGLHRDLAAGTCVAARSVDATCKRTGAALPLHGRRDAGLCAVPVRLLFGGPCTHSSARLVKGPAHRGAPTGSPMGCSSPAAGIMPATGDVQSLTQGKASVLDTSCARRGGTRSG